MKIMWITIVAAVVLTGSGCEESTSSSNALRGPSGLRAYSASASSVGLQWTKSPDTGNPAVLSPAYQLVVRETTGVLHSTTTIVAAQETLTYGGLTEGRVYDFVMTLRVGSGAETHDSTKIRWAPARRFETLGSFPIQVFETRLNPSDQQFRNSLDIYSSSGGPQNYFLPGTGNDSIDFYIAPDATSPDLLIRSASLWQPSPLPRMTVFSTFTVDSDDLKNPQSVPPSTSTYTTLEVRVSGASSGITRGKIIYGRTHDGNYFRLLIVRNNASYIFGATPNRFLTFQISYQSQLGIIYAAVPPRGPQGENGHSIM